MQDRFDQDSFISVVLTAPDVMVTLLDCYLSVATLLCPIGLGTYLFLSLFCFRGGLIPPHPTPSRLRPIGLICLNMLQHSLVIVLVTQMMNNFLLSKEMPNSLLLAEG